MLKNERKWKIIEIKKNNVFSWNEIKKWVKFSLVEMWNPSNEELRELSLTNEFVWENSVMNYSSFEYDNYYFEKQIKAVLICWAIVWQGFDRQCW